MVTRAAGEVAKAPYLTLLRQDLFDPRDRLVDGLLGADLLSCDAMDRLWPDHLLLNQVMTVRRADASC
jgi:hypothetical protein